MIFPKNIPHGLSAFGVGAASTSLYLANRKEAAQREANNELSKKLDEVNSGLKDLGSEVKKLDSDLQEVETDIKEIKAGQNSSKESIVDKSSKFTSNFTLPSIQDLFNRTVEFFSSFDLFTQALIFNILTSSFLFSLLFSFLIGKYGNYIIDRFNLTERYPRFSNILNLRLKIQKYYFTYLTVLAIITLLLNIFLNVTTLITIN